MSDLINKLNAAYRLAEWYREGGIAWVVLLDQLVEREFYGINKRGRHITAYLNGLRVEL